LSKSNTIDLDTFTPDSKPYGKTFDEWAEEWMKWALSIPKIHNPAADSTGKNCAQNQNGPVWFLAGTFGGSMKRQCTIPVQKAIFFPVVTKECSFAEDYDLKTEQELSKRVKEVMDCVTYMELIVDGFKLQNLKQYRAHSQVFDLNFPENNVYDVEAGPTRSVTDGYWVFLKPLPIGKHEIYFNAEVSLPKESRIVELVRRYNKIKGTVFKIEVLYDITIKPNG
jgi:hypothetical protein